MAKPTCKALSSLWRLVMVWRTCCKKTKALLLDLTVCPGACKAPSFSTVTHRSDELYGQPSTPSFFSPLTCNDCVIPQYTNTSLGHLRHAWHCLPHFPCCQCGREGNVYRSTEQHRPHGNSQAVSVNHFPQHQFAQEQAEQLG